MHATSNQYSVGPYSSIVQVLKDYGEVPVGFLAATLGIPSDEAAELLSNLEREGVVERKGDHVRLARRKGKARSLA
jgi:Mn-dependent DtxR family transcriptional regulator